MSCTLLDYTAVFVNAQLYFLEWFNIFYGSLRMKGIFLFVLWASQTHGSRLVVIDLPLDINENKMRVVLLKSECSLPSFYYKMSFEASSYDVHNCIAIRRDRWVSNRLRLCGNYGGNFVQRKLCLIVMSDFSISATRFGELLIVALMHRIIDSWRARLTSVKERKLLRCLLMHITHCICL